MPGGGKGSGDDPESVPEQNALVPHPKFGRESRNGWQPAAGQAPQPGSAPGTLPFAHELHPVWIQLGRRWSSVVVVPSEPDLPTADIARALSEVGARLSVYPVDFIDARGIDVETLAGLIARMRTSGEEERGQQADEGFASLSWAPPITRTIVALESPLANPLAIPVALASDGVVLCVGALVAAMARRDGGAAPLVRGSRRAAVVLAAISLVLGGWCAATHLGLPVLHPLRTTLYAMFFAALTLMSVQDPRQSLVARQFHASWLRLLGKYSYGLYVYHGILAQHMHQLHVQEKLASLLGGHSRGMIAYALVGASVSLLVAALSYELFERRFLALKQFFESRRTQPAGSQPGGGPTEHAGRAA